MANDIPEESAHLILFNTRTYFREANGLLKEIGAYDGRKALDDLPYFENGEHYFEYAKHAHLDLSQLINELTELRDQMRQEARARGWEID